MKEEFIQMTEVTSFWIKDRRDVATKFATRQTAQISPSLFTQPDATPHAPVGNNTIKYSLALRSYDIPNHASSL
jgi:hypothetical protein